jgi:hypothetical protein
MKNEHKENEVPRGPLILLAPTSNQVAILSLDWFDGTIRAIVPARAQGWNYLANRPRIISSKAHYRHIWTDRS